jgi:hypothetical protein
MQDAYAVAQNRLIIAQPVRDQAAVPHYNIRTSNARVRQQPQNVMIGTLDAIAIALMVHKTAGIPPTLTSMDCQ